MAPKKTPPFLPDRKDQSGTGSRQPPEPAPIAPAAGDEVKDDVTLSIRISRELRDLLYDEAKATHRSLNGLITLFCEMGMAAVAESKREASKPGWMKPRKPK
jgi:hypothetical protein